MSKFRANDDPFEVNPKQPSCRCKRPTMCNPCGDKCMPICGMKNPNLTCRPGGRPWGRATGPVCFKDGRWIAATKKISLCAPIRIKGRKKEGLPYGFGIYARHIYPYGLPCKGNFCLPKPSCNKCFYPMLPTKPGKVYSFYTFNNRGPPYTCPRPCIC